VGLIGLALTSAVLLNARDAIGPLAFLPFSLIAATLTVRDTHSESYELLTATEISDTLPATTVPLPTWLVAF